MKILFICKHNRFRSKVAEAIFNRLNRNKKIIGESAGILIDELHLYVAESVIDIMKKKGYVVGKSLSSFSYPKKSNKVTQGFFDVGGIPRRVDVKKINDYDYLIIVADNVDPLFFKDSYNGKIIWGKIDDCDEKDLIGIRERVDRIEEKVKKFVEDLKNN